MKRRKIRKGTFSCWECKHRKTRCEFESASNTTCLSCQRRGLPCISQECADPESNSRDDAEEHVVHLESLFSQLIQQRSKPQTPPPGRASTLDEDRYEFQNGASKRTRVVNEVQLPPLPLLEPFSDQRSLSSHLYPILPQSSTIALIMTRGKFASLPSRTRTQSLRKSLASVRNVDALQASKVPSPTAHPICFARTLVQLALCLQHFDAATSRNSNIQLGEPFRDAAQRYVHIASYYVTSQDSLVDSVDGLETLMFEATYRVNSGTCEAHGASSDELWLSHSWRNSLNQLRKQAAVGMLYGSILIMVISSCQ